MDEFTIAVIHTLSTACDFEICLLVASLDMHSSVPVWHPSLLVA